jgi:hypothetical protein
MTKREKESVRHGIIATAIFVSCVTLYHFNKEDKFITRAESEEVEQIEDSEPSREPANAAPAPAAASQIHVQAEVPPAAAQTADKTSAMKYVNEVQFRIDQLNKCYNEECPMEKVDPRTDYFTIGQKVKAELEALRSHVNANHLVDESVAKIARDALENDDGHVQEVALDIIATQNPSEENLDTILEKVVKGYDDKLIAQAMNELKRYTSEADQEKIRNVLSEEILHGTPFVAQAIAQKIGMFINAKTVAYYKGLADKVGPGTIVYNNLKASIDAFQRGSSEG